MGRATRTIEIQSIAEDISIHALRGEGDAKIAIPIRKRGVISIHALRGEGDHISTIDFEKKRGISIHALRGEGDENSLRQKHDGAISIHALRGEGDAKIILSEAI